MSISTNQCKNSPFIHSVSLFQDEFARLMELSEEKLQIASQSYDTVGDDSLTSK